MKKRITKTVVEKAEAGEKDSFAWDTEVKGFGVRVRPSGQRYYVLKTRVSGRQRWFTIGQHGSPWTADMARDEALRLLVDINSGKDPSAQRDAKKLAIDVAGLAERFFEEYVAQRCKEKTQRDYRQIVEQHIVPALGKRGIADLGRSDVSKFHHDLRKTPYMANRCLAVLSKMMNLAEEWGLRQEGTNPCRHVKKYKEEQRQRWLSEEELKRMGKALRTAEQKGAHTPWFLAAIRLLLFTGARLSEITTLKWEHVDLKAGLLKLPDSKTGKKVIPLNEPALAVLQNLPRDQDNPYVIVGKKPQSHLVEIQKPWRRLRASAELPDLRIHDLRHNYATVAAGLGQGLPLIGKLLGHSQAQTTMRYAHADQDPLKAATNAVGQNISDALNAVQRTKSGRKRVRLT